MTSPYTSPTSFGHDKSLPADHIPHEDDNGINPRASNFHSESRSLHTETLILHKSALYSEETSFSNHDQGRGADDKSTAPEIGFAYHARFSATRITSPFSGAGIRAKTQKSDAQLTWRMRQQNSTSTRFEEDIDAADDLILNARFCLRSRKQPNINSLHTTHHHLPVLTPQNHDNDLQLSPSIKIEDSDSEHETETSSLTVPSPSQSAFTATGTVRMTSISFSESYEYGGDFENKENVAPTQQLPQQISDETGGGSRNTTPSPSPGLTQDFLDGVQMSSETRYVVHGSTSTSGFSSGGIQLQAQTNDPPTRTITPYFGPTTESENTFNSFVRDPVTSSAGMMARSVSDLPNISGEHNGAGHFSNTENRRSVLMNSDEVEDEFAVKVEQRLEQAYGLVTELKSLYGSLSVGDSSHNSVLIFEDPEERWENGGRPRSRNVKFDPVLKITSHSPDLESMLHSPRSKQSLLVSPLASQGGFSVRHSDRNRTGLAMASDWLDVDARSSGLSSTCTNRLPVHRTAGLDDELNPKSDQMKRHRLTRLQRLSQLEAESHKLGAGKHLSFLQTKRAGKRRAGVQMMRNQIWEDGVGNNDEIDMHTILDKDQLQSSGRKVVGLETMSAKKNSRRGLRREINQDKDQASTARQSALNLSSFCNSGSFRLDTASTSIPDPFNTSHLDSKKQSVPDTEADTEMGM